MINQINEKINKTREFYDKYPIADGSFREGVSTLKMEDIQIDYKDLENKLILDCGCGPGNVSINILKSVKNPNLISMDLSLNSLKILKERQKEFKNKNTQIKGDILKIPFKKDVFDFVISSGVVHHTPDPFKALDNLYYIMGKNGRMYFSVYNRNSFYFPEFNTIGVLLRFFYKNEMKKSLNLSRYLFKKLLSVINGQSISDSNVQKIFADRYLTPVASFHAKKEAENWVSEKNLKILKTGKCKLGTLIWFLVEKREA